MGPIALLYICERGLHRIRRLDPQTSELSTYAGTGVEGFAGDGGLATAAKLAEPHELRFDHTGNLYWTDMKNHVIRRVERKTGLISTFAGIGGEAGFSGDGGPATQARLKQPHSLAFDDAGNLYIADIGNHRIRRVAPRTGLIETVAGTGEKRLPEDGAAAKSSPILGPRALFVAGDTLWIALREGNAVWKMDLEAGTLHHVGGTGEAGFAVADGPVKQAQFYNPKGIAVGPDGIVYVVDSSNHVLRKIDPARHRFDRRRYSTRGWFYRRRGTGGPSAPEQPARRLRCDRRHDLHRRQRQQPRTACEPVTAVVAAQIRTVRGHGARQGLISASY